MTREEAVRWCLERGYGFIEKSTGTRLCTHIKEASGVQHIEHPPHYCTGKIETWDYIADKDFDYFLGNVIKYVSRAGRKGDYIEDLLKARAYLDKAIDLEHERRITSCSE